MLEDSNDNLWLAEAASGNIWNIASGGDFSMATPFATSTLWVDGFAEFDGAVYEGESGGRIVPIAGGGDLSSTAPFATVESVSSMVGVSDQAFYVLTSGGDVHEVSAGGDFTSATPWATGVATDTVYSELYYVHGCGDGVLWSVGGEECDDGNTSSGDGCSATCTTEGAGGGGAGGSGGTGTGGTGTGGTGTGGAGATGGSGSTPVDSEDDSGCGCRLASPRDGQARWAVVGLLGLMLASTRRQRRAAILGGSTGTRILFRRNA